MSTVKANNYQVGQSITATNNFTLYQPSTPDGSVRLGVGNSGSTTLDALKITNTGALTAPADATIHGITVGLGGGSIASNTALGGATLPSNSSGTNNTAVGYAAIYANTTGSHNTGVGYGAYSGSGTTATGSYNIAIGSYALTNNTTASNNTAVGYQAGYSNTTGTGSTFLGYQAGYALTGANRITALGYNAALSTTGNNNTCIGAWSGNAITTGAYNTFVGDSSGPQNNGTISCSSNVGVGYDSLQALTTGNNNTALGDHALFYNTTASNNTAVGYQAGYSNTLGIGGASFGYQASYGNVNSSYQTAIGYRALYAWNNTGADSYNTAIGYNSGSALTTGVKNTILGAYTGNQGGLDIRTANNYIVLSDGDGNPRGIFDSSGYFYVGCTSQPSATVRGFSIGNGSGNTVSSAGAVSTAYNHLMFYNTNGNVGTIQSSGSSTAYVTSSDYRLKHDITPMQNALAKVAQLKPVTYKWNADDSDGQGFIAHELQAVIPEAVTGEKDAVDAEGNPVYQGIDPSKIVATLTAAIQEQQAIIESLQADIAILKGK